MGEFEGMEWDGEAQARERLVVRGEVREELAMLRLETMYRVEGLLEAVLRRKRGESVREKRQEIAALVDLMTSAESILKDEVTYQGANVELTRRCMSVWWKVLRRFEELLRGSGMSTRDVRRISLAMGKLEKLMRGGEQRDHATASGKTQRNAEATGDGGREAAEALEGIREQARDLIRRLGDRSPGGETAPVGPDEE